MKAGIDFDGNRESALFFDSEVVEGSDETDVRGGGSSQSLENPDEVFVGVHFCEFARSDDRVDDGSPPSSGRVSQEQPVFATYCRGPYPPLHGIVVDEDMPLVWSRKQFQLGPAVEHVRCGPSGRAGR